MAKYFILFSILLAIPAAAFGAVSYSRTPSGSGQIASPVTLDLSFDSWDDIYVNVYGATPIGLMTNCTNNPNGYWGIGICPGLESGCSIEMGMISSPGISCGTHSVSLPFNLPAGDYGAITIYQSDESGNFFGGDYLEGNEPNPAIFTVTSSPDLPADSPNIGIANISPTVKLNTQVSGIYRGQMTLTYSVFDPDTGPAALAAQPMNFEYCAENRMGCREIAKDQENSGTYSIDTNKIPDGSYKIRVVARDGYDFGEAFSDVVTIDNTGPTFDVFLSTSSLIRETDKVELKIISSETLKEKPALLITQEGAEALPVEINGSGKEFSATFLPQRGYPGTAVVSISGQDLIGNEGDIITSGKTFSIGRFGPPPPKINMPSDGQIFAQSLIEVSGKSEPNVKISLLLNGVNQFSAQTAEDGNFHIDNVNLSETNKGSNIISIFGVNEKGERSGEVVLKVKLNSPPFITIDSAFEKIISGEKEMDWSAFDQNDDKLVFSIEYSNDGGITWDSVASDFTETSYKIDTSILADGSGYLLRVSADDGMAKNYAISKSFAIKNDFPHISLDTPASYFINTSTPEFSGIATSSFREIDGVDFSLDLGKTWEKGTINRISGMTSLNFYLPISTPLPDGKYIILIRVKTASGHFVKIARSFTVDTALPDIQVVSPSLDNPVIDRSDTNPEIDGLQIVFSGKTEPRAKIELLLGNKSYGAIADKDGNFRIKDATLIPHGINDFTANATDRAGNFSQIKNKIISNNPPQISVSRLENGDYLGNKTEIIWQAKDLDNDPLSAEISFADNSGKSTVLAEKSSITPGVDNTYKWDLSRLPNGKYGIKITAGDGLNDAKISLDIFVDNVPPQGSFNLGKNSFSNNPKPVFFGQAHDDFSGIQYVEYSLDDKNWYKATISEGYQEKAAKFEFQHRFPLSDGEYKVRVRVQDRAGNIVYLEPRNLTIDTTPPRIGSNMISSGALALFPDESGAIELFADSDYNFLIAVGGDAAEVKLTSGQTIFNLTFNNATALWESRLNFKAPGDYSLEISAKDKSGNSKTQKINSLKVLQKGYVYDEKDNQKVAGANASLYILDSNTNSWLIWDGAAFGQENPQKTGESGEYGFLVPPGKYKLKIWSGDFGTVNSAEFETKNNYLLSTNIPVTRVKGLFKFFNEVLNLFGN